MFLTTNDYLSILITGSNNEAVGYRYRLTAVTQAEKHRTCLSLKLLKTCTPAKEIDNIMLIMLKAV
jgi:hypothetical protein